MQPAELIENASRILWPSLTLFFLIIVNPMPLIFNSLLFHIAAVWVFFSWKGGMAPKIEPWTYTLTELYPRIYLKNKYHEGREVA